MGGFGRDVREWVGGLVGGDTKAVLPEGKTEVITMIRNPSYIKKKKYCK